MGGSFSAEAQFFVGAPGSGKTYSAMVRCVTYLVARRRPLVTNVELHKHSIAHLCRQLSREEFGDFDYETLIHYHDIASDIKFWEWVPENCLFLFDEPHVYFPAQEWQRISKEHAQLVIWLSQHRHYGVDIIYMTQNWGMVAKPMRDTAGIVYTFHNLNKLRVSWFKFAPPQRFVWAMHYADIKGHALDSGEFTPNPEIFTLYKSKSQKIGSVMRRPLNDIRPEGEHDAPAPEPPRTWAAAVWVWCKEYPLRASAFFAILAFGFWMIFGNSLKLHGQYQKFKNPAKAAKPVTAPASVSTNAVALIRAPLPVGGPKESARPALVGTNQVVNGVMYVDGLPCVSYGRKLLKEEQSTHGWTFMGFEGERTIWRHGKEVVVVEIGDALPRQDEHAE